MNGERKRAKQKKLIDALKIELFTNIEDIKFSDIDFG